MEDNNLKAGELFFELTDNEFKEVFNNKVLLKYINNERLFSKDKIIKFFNILGYNYPTKFNVNSIEYSENIYGFLCLNFNIKYNLYNNSIIFSYNILYSINKDIINKMFRYNDIIIKTINKNNTDFSFKYPIKSNSLNEVIDSMKQYYDEYYKGFEYFVNSFGTNDTNKILKYWCVYDIIPSFESYIRFLVDDYMILYNYGVSLFDFFGLVSFKWFNEKNNDKYLELINSDLDYIKSNINQILQEYSIQLQKYKDYKEKINIVNKEYVSLLKELSNKYNIPEKVFIYKLTYKEFNKDLKKIFE